MFPIKPDLLTKEEKQFVDSIAKKASNLKQAWETFSLDRKIRMIKEMLLRSSSFCHNV